MRKRTSKAIKAGVGYTLGNILVKGIGFISLPIFSRLMTPEEFGVYNIFISYEAFLYVIIGFAIHSSIRNANLEFRGRIDEYTSSVTLIYVSNLVIFSILAFVLRKRITLFIGFDIVIVFLLLIYSFGSAVLTLYNERMALDYAYKRYLQIAIFNSVGNISISLFMIFTFFFNCKDYGRIVGTTITLGAITVFVLWKLYCRARPRYNRVYWKFAVRYSLPIVPHGISQVLLSQFDRIMIRQLVGNSEAGIYSLAANVQLILTIIINSVIIPWNTWFYERVDRNEVQLLKNKARELCTLFAIFAIGLIAISPELIYILGGERYSVGKYVAIPLIVASFFIFLYDMVVLGEYYTKKTQYIMLTTMLAALLNIITNYIFIRKFGFIVAAYTTLFSYFIYLLLHMTVSKKLIGFYIIPLNGLIGYISYMCFSAVLSIIFINHIVIRWSLCLFEILPFAMWLYKKNSETIKEIVIRGRI